MTVVARESEQRPVRFQEWTPAQIREALTPEYAESFDRHWRRLMREAVEAYDLSAVEEALTAWRMTAAVTAAHGHDAFRAMLADAEHRLRTGERPPGSVSWSRLKVELGLDE